MNPWVIASGTVIAAIVAAIGVITAARIAKQSIEAYRKQKQADSENYRRQKEIDRREEVAKRQREAYEHYFKAWWDTNRYAGTELHGEAKAIYQNARDSLFFYASDEGLQKVNEFHRYIVNTPTNKNQETVEDLLAAVLLALRKDCYGTTTLTVEDIKAGLTVEFA